MQFSNLGKLWNSLQSYWSASEEYFRLVERRFALADELTREINRILDARDRLTEAEIATCRDLLRRNSVTEQIYHRIDICRGRLAAVEQMKHLIGLQRALLRDLKQFTWH